MKYFLIQLGCQMNQSDGERIRTVIESLGYTAGESEEDADLLGIVACSVRQKAIDKVYSKIEKWNRQKNERNLLTFVSGCILPADREKFLDRFDLLFSINDLPQLPDMIRQYGVVTPVSGIARNPEYDPASIAARSVEEQQKQESRKSGTSDPSTTAAPVLSVAALKQSRGGKGKALTAPRPTDDRDTSYWHIGPSYQSSFEAYIPIQNGCDKFCTFCAVPYTRGREVSRSSEDIFSEVRELVSKGYRSITLLGQNVNSYGLDRKGEEISFADLLRGIGEIGIETGADFWTYFTSPHPRDMTDEVIDTIAAYPVLAKMIHLPVQSGDDKVLIRMNRNHGVARYRKIVEKIRSTIPQATLFTDIIVGFTGETGEQFENTRKIMEEFQYNMAFIAMYSPRPGAASARWDDDISVDEKKRRMHLLQEELKKSSYAYNKSLIGTVVRVLVDGKDRKAGYLSGRTEGKLTVRFSSGDESLIGSFVYLEITSCRELSLEGTIVAPERVVNLAS